MVAAEDERGGLLGRRPRNERRDPTAHVQDRLEEPGPLVPDGSRLGNRRLDVPPVDATHTQSLELRFEARVANRRGAHVHAAAILAEIKGSADDRDGACGLHAHARKASVHP